MVLITIVSAVISLTSGGLGVAAFRQSSPRRHRATHRRNPYAAPIGVQK